MSDFFFPRRLRSLATDQRGLILVVSLMLIGVMSALAVGYSTMMQADTVLTGSTRRARDGFYAAEAGLNTAMATFTKKFKEYGIPSGNDFNQQTLTIGKRTVYYKADLASQSACDDAEPSCYAVIPAGETFAGLNAITYRYVVSSEAVNSDGDTEAELGAQFDVLNIPIFQFLVFADQDLSMWLSPPVEASGRVHTNGKLNFDSDSTLAIIDRPSPPNPAPGNPFVQISSADTISRGRSYTSLCGGSVFIDTLADEDADGSLDPLELPCVGTGTTVVPEETLALYKGSLKAHVDPLEVPPADVMARGGSGTFWQKADLRIVLRLDQTSSTPFGNPGLCPGAPPSPLLHPIEVQNSDGSRDVGKTTELWRFMCERRGALFYNDRPTGAVDGTPTDSLASNPNNYNPAFGGGSVGTAAGDEHTYGSVSYNGYHVYRRIGEDTNGDGVINNNDFNPDICPNTDPAVNEVWEPPYCNTIAAGTNRWFSDTDYRRGGFYHFRENRWMYLLNLNMRALIEWNVRNTEVLFDKEDTTDGGLVIFLSVQENPINPTTAPTNTGVRIFDSTDLDMLNTTFPPGASDPTGLTTVSDVAIYIQDNFNAVDKYPAAVNGDSLNVNSQSWERPVSFGGQVRANDRKSYNDMWDFRPVLAQDFPCHAVNPCTAANNYPYFAINAASLAGQGTNWPAVPGTASFATFPRQLEDWTGDLLVWRGAFASFGVPQYASGWWGNEPTYRPPDRDWDYDADFNQVENLPPLTPLVTFVEQRLFTRMYK